MIVEAILENYIVLCIATHFISIIVLQDLDYGLAFFNPIRNYKAWTSMNWFGVILCTTFLHVLLPVYAVCYWFYKLCTFGRKQDKE